MLVPEFEVQVELQVGYQVGHQAVYRAETQMEVGAVGPEFELKTQPLTSCLYSLLEIQSYFG